MAAEMLKIAGLAVIAVCAALVIRQYRPELALAVGAAAGAALLYFGMEHLMTVREAAMELLGRYGAELTTLGAALKVVGIAYIAQFAADLCRDSGESAVASKVELAGRIMMLSVAFPMIAGVLNAIGGLMGQ